MVIWKFLTYAILLTLASSNVSYTTPLIFFMDDCSNEQIYYSITTSAIVYSHRGYVTRTKYDFSFRCILRFTPALPKWRIAVKVLDYDLPVEPYLDGSCSDNLVFSNLTLSYYNNKIAVMDDRNQFASGEAVYICNQMRKKYGNSTLEYFSEGESQFYVGFETGSVAKGGGFKLLVTAFTSASASEACASARDQKNSLLFACNQGPNTFCINSNLTCDRMPNCPGTKDVGDEPPIRSCNPKGPGAPVTFVDKLLSLGIAASLSISIGTVLVVIVCLVISVCLCRRFVCRDRKRRGPGSTASYGVGPAGAYCANSRTGSAVGGPGGAGSFISASQRSQFLANATINSGGPYTNINNNNIYSNNSSVKQPPQDYRAMSPSHFSENVGSIGGGSLGANYWGHQHGMVPQQQSHGNGVRVQYMVAPRHFGASPNPMQPGYSSVNDSGSPHTTRPSQISSSGFGGSQTQALPQFNADGVLASQGQGRSTTPSSKSARSNGATSSSYATGGGGAQPPQQQPFLPKQPINSETNDGESPMSRGDEQQPFMYYARSTQQQVNL